MLNYQYLVVIIRRTKPESSEHRCLYYVLSSEYSTRLSSICILFLILSINLFYTHLFPFHPISIQLSPVHNQIFFNFYYRLSQFQLFHSEFMSLRPKATIDMQCFGCKICTTRKHSRAWIQLYRQEVNNKTRWLIYPESVDKPV